jgi:hypothetical protein
MHVVEIFKDVDTLMTFEREIIGYPSKLQVIFNEYFGGRIPPMRQIVFNDMGRARGMIFKFEFNSLDEAVLFKLTYGGKE